MITQNNMEQKTLEDEARELYYDLSRMKDVLEHNVTEDYFVLKYVDQRQCDEKTRETMYGQGVLEYPRQRKERRCLQL